MDALLERLQQYYTALIKSLPRIGLALLLFIVGIFIARWIQRFLQQKILHHSHDPLMSDFLGKALKLAILIAVFMLTLHVAGLSGIAGALLATAGASAIVLGFAFKDIVENFLAGIILAFNRPFHINDTVKIDEVFGRVKEMKFRYTKITTFDGRNVYIPNADVLKKAVYNYTEDGYFRTDFVVGIAYENDPESAKKIITQCLEETPGLVHDEEHINFVAEEELAASTVNLKVYFWVHTADFRRGMLQTRGALISSIKQRLEAASFNLPAEIRELKFYSASDPFPIRTEPEQKDTLKRSD